MNRTILTWFNLQLTLGISESIFSTMHTSNRPHTVRSNHYSITSIAFLEPKYSNKVFVARSRYLRQGLVITSHSKLRDVINYSCLRYLLLATKSWCLGCWFSFLCKMSMITTLCFIELCHIRISYWPTQKMFAGKCSNRHIQKCHGWKSIKLTWKTPRYIKYAFRETFSVKYKIYVLRSFLRNQFINVLKWMTSFPWSNGR